MTKPDTTDRFTQIAFAVITTLITAGVIGVWSMSGSLGRLEERVAIWTKVGNDKMDYITARVDEIQKQQRDSERRIGLLEGASRK
ncbi:hypothetical protein [Bradyrhizobium cenepequi]